VFFPTHASGLSIDQILSSQLPSCYSHDRPLFGHHEFFAAVGLADVVIRVGKELYGFLAAIKGAPTEIRRLQSDLRDLELIVSEVKLYWEEFNLSSSPANRHDVLHSFVSSLEAVREEFFCLGRLGQDKEGIAKRLAGKIKWVFEEREIAKSLKRLESHKAALNIALILVGR
jgi:hypothetical protein